MVMSMRERWHSHTGKRFPTDQQRNAGQDQGVMVVLHSVAACGGTSAV